MANEMQIFKNDEFGQVRIVEINNEPYFVGKDVAEALGYAKPENAISNHVDDEDKTTTLIQGTGSNYKSNAVCINESGIYSLVFGSKLPTAKKFKRWVTHEVLPSIRKTGTYGIPQNYAEALQLAADQAKQLLEQKPKVEFFDAVAESKDAIEIASVAKVLDVPGVGRNKLFEFLRNRKILMRNNQPYQKYVDCGYFRIIEQKYERPNGDTCINIKTLVYQKGVKYIQELLKGAHM
jgi:anti-repressor protein